MDVDLLHVLRHFAMMVMKKDSVSTSAALDQTTRIRNSSVLFQNWILFPDQVTEFERRLGSTTSVSSWKQKGHTNVLIQSRFYTV